MYISDPSLCKFSATKSSDKLTVNIEHVYCTVYTNVQSTHLPYIMNAFMETIDMRTLDHFILKFWNLLKQDLIWI